MAGNAKDDLAKALAGMSADAPAADAQEATEESHEVAEPLKGSAQIGRPGSPTKEATPVRSTAQASPGRVEAAAKPVELKRTIIPILLTLGLMLVLFGAISMGMGELSPLGEQVLVPIAMMAVGLLTIGAGVLTMLQVRHHLQSPL